MESVADPAVRSDERDFPLLRVIDGVREHEGRIVARVEARRAEIAARTGLGGRALADALARDLVDDYALKSAAIGGGAAAPLTLPLLGPWVSFALAVLGGALWQIANEVELCYAVAAAYRVNLPAAKLRMVSFWLVRLSNYDDLQSMALAMGVRITVRKLVEKLIAVGLARAVATTTSHVMMGRAIATSGAGAPWYVRATAWLGVPVLAVLGWRSTQGVGERAIAYFSEA
ncbi:MAG: hypothetical protein ACOZNI_12435 [Myxococcota bacterium]